MKQELIKRFERETDWHLKDRSEFETLGERVNYYASYGEEYWDAFHDFLIETVIADLQSENEHLEYGIERYQWWCGTDIKTIEKLETKLQSLQEKYDKLNERVGGKCIWADQSDIEMDGTYETSCDNMWAFTEDGIKENGITYCPFCGKRIVELTPEEMEMNDE